MFGMAYFYHSVNMEFVNLTSMQFLIVLVITMFLCQKMNWIYLALLIPESLTKGIPENREPGP